MWRPVSSDMAHPTDPVHQDLELSFPIASAGLVSHTPPWPLFLVSGPHRRRLPQIENVHPGHDPKVRAIIRNCRSLDFPVPQLGTHHDGALKKPRTRHLYKRDLPFYAHGRASVAHSQSGRTYQPRARLHAHGPNSTVSSRMSLSQYFTVFLCEDREKLL